MVKRGTRLSRKITVTEVRLLQAIQAHFCALNGIVNTPQTAFARLIGEAQECNEALANDDLKEVKGELADLVIFSLTVANTYAIDFDAEIMQMAQTLPGVDAMADQTEGPVANTLNITTLQDAQRQYNQLEGNPPTAQEAYQKMVETTGEVQRAIEKHDIRRVSRGLVGIVLCVMDIANHYQIDLAGAITDKFTRNYIKYNPAKSKALLESGMTEAEMLETHRSQWNRSDDGNYIK